MLSFQIWKDAASQALFSQSIALGGIQTLASYNNFHNNMIMDSVIVTVANLGRRAVKSAI